MEKIYRVEKARKNEESIAAGLAEFAFSQTFDRLPKEVVQRAKEIILDTLGIMVRATSAPSLSNLRNLLVDQDTGNSSVIGTTHKAHASIAALLNASLPTIIQYDEGHRMARGHPAIHIVPTALALAEDKGVTGKDLILAVVIGYEVAVRIAFSLYPMHSQVHPHGSWASIGAAVSAGKILCFTKQQFVDLINSISTLTLATWRKATTSGATIHHLAPGLGAFHAIIAAFSTQAGLTGPSSCLEEYFLPFASKHSKTEGFTSGLGTNFEILNNYFKTYPSCAHTHSSIEALEKILEKHPIRLEEIEGIEVRTHGEAYELSEQNPVNTLAGIFSIPYCIGMRLVKGQITIGPIAAEDPIDPQILKAASLVRLVKDETLQPSFPLGRPSLVRIRLKNGTEQEQFVALTRERLTDKELREKFIEMVEMHIGEKRGEELSEKITDLENVTDIRQLFTYFSMG